MRSPEQNLWMAVLLRLVQDACLTDEQIRLSATREWKYNGKRDAHRVRYATRGDLKRAWVAHEHPRRVARQWLQAKRDCIVVAEYAGIDGAHFMRMVSRLRRNGWQPIGIELGEEFDKVMVRDRREAMR